MVTKENEYVQTAVWRTRRTQATVETVVSTLDQSNIMPKRFYEKASKRQQWGVVAGIFLTFGILGGVANSQTPVFGFLTIGSIAGGVAWMMATKSGVQFAKAWNIDNSSSNTSNQQTTINSRENNEPTKICSSCGWKNPKSNTYCHDCGSELTAGSSSDQGD